MDTRFWGPSGWKLLHSITSQYPLYPGDKDKETYHIFFRTLPFILPCIYCRMSLSDYYQKIPITEKIDAVGYPLDSRHNLNYWLYTIHNLVNDKLRGQGLIKTPNPEFKVMNRKYAGKDYQDGWDFLYAIVLNYPDNTELISSQQRQNYTLFLNYLPSVIQDSNLRESLSDFYKENPVIYYTKDREPLTKWLYALEKTCTNCKSCFTKRCRQVERYRAGCKGNSKYDKKPTCRRIKLNN